MAMTTEICRVQEQMETVVSISMLEDDVLEEIDEDASSFDNPVSSPPSEISQPYQQTEEFLSPPESPSKPGRNFGNISPISDLLDEDDLEVVSAEEREPDGESGDPVDDNAGKVTPEPEPRLNRGSFPRISDGRSSPILAYSPSLIKSPSSSSTNNNKSRLHSSPSSGGSEGGAGKRPRNIARMLDNISDHSSGDEEVNSVGTLMAKFTV